MKRYHLFAILLIGGLVGLLVLGGCGSSEKSETQPSSKSKSVETEVGDVFSFGLDSNPGTGYTWTLSKPVDEKIVKLTATRYHGASKPGEPGREAFWFSAVGEGKATIDMEYVRPWEKGVAPKDTYTVSVDVTGKDVGEIKEYSDPNTPIDAVAGGEFVIVLDSNPTTGYKWVLGASLPDIVVLENTSYTAEEGPKIGSGGKEYWRFDGEKAGSGEITLNYVRPWEKDVAPAKTETFKVDVK